MGFTCMCLTGKQALQKRSHMCRCEKQKRKKKLHGSPKYLRVQPAQLSPAESYQIDVDES